MLYTTIDTNETIMAAPKSVDADPTSSPTRSDSTLSGR